MPNPNFMILYATDPLKSASFYETLLGQPPMDASPGLVLFTLKSGLMPGLWKRDAVEPLAVAAAGSGELGLTVADAAMVDRTHADWLALGVGIVQAPADKDFGRTFCAVDPDGNRLRVFAPA
jgi:predicted enzyme related to lactoylglutathione lyase